MKKTMNDYKALKIILIKKYGKSKDKKRWNNDFFKSNNNQYDALAIRNDNLTLYSNWTNNNTDIDLMIMGSDFKFITSITYTTKIPKLINLLKVKKQQEENNKYKINEAGF